MSRDEGLVSWCGPLHEQDLLVLAVAALSGDNLLAHAHEPLS